MFVALVAFTVGPFAFSPPAHAAATGVTGSACGYIANVGLFGGPQQLNGCGGPAGAGSSPSVSLPGGGSDAPVTGAKADGASAKYGPAVIFGGRWPGDVQTAPPSGPISVSTKGTPATGVTSSADIAALDPKQPVPCEPNPSPPTPKPTDGQVCDKVGGFGPWPVEGDSLHVECTATESAVTGKTTFSHADLATATTPDGSPDPDHTEAVPDNPPVNYTRSGIITNVGDVFTAVYNEQIVGADGSLTVNAVHMYLFGPTAVGEVIKGQAKCGTTPAGSPAPLSATDTQAPICGVVDVEPVSPTDATPKSPRTELIGVFDSGGLQSVTPGNTGGANLAIGNSSGLPYLKLQPGQTGPLAVTATGSGDADFTWSFDATDKAGNTTHAGDGPGQCPKGNTPGTPAPDEAKLTSADFPRASGGTGTGGNGTGTGNGNGSGNGTGTNATGTGNSTARTTSTGVAKTGIDVLPLVVGAGVLALCGALLMLTTRRRR